MCKNINDTIRFYLTVNYLLLYGVRVVIYSGQLDIICATQGECVCVCVCFIIV